MVVKTFPSKNSSRFVYVNLFEICTKNTSSKLGDGENCKCFPQTHTHKHPMAGSFPTSFKPLLLVRQEPCSLLLKIIIANNRDIFPDYIDFKPVQF